MHCLELGVTCVVLGVAAHHSSAAFPVPMRMQAVLSQQPQPCTALLHDSRCSCWHDAWHHLVRCLQLCTWQPSLHLHTHGAHSLPKLLPPAPCVPQSPRCSPAVSHTPRPLPLQEVATIAWAYAQLGCREPLLMLWLAMEVASAAGQLNPQDIANLAWAFAKLGHYNPAVLEALAGAALRFLGSGSGSSSSLKPGSGSGSGSTAGSANSKPGRSGSVGSEVGGSVVGAAGSAAGSGSDTVEDDAADGSSATAASSTAKDSRSSRSSSRQRFSPQGLSNLLWAFAKLAHYHGPLLEATCAALGPLLPRCTIQDLQHCVWALAVLNHYDALLTDQIAARVAELQAAAAVAKAQRFSAIWWGLAVLGHLDPGVFRGAAALLSQARPQQFGSDEMCQLMQVSRPVCGARHWQPALIVAGTACVACCDAPC